jgi:NAD(P)-dependent dehydrogenase (short-subunit alcohol dehydrogenase family)
MLSHGSASRCRLLLSDYSRRGFVDGRGVRLPSVIVRAGAPNAAVTGCFSSVIREPLAGSKTVAPIEAHIKHAVTGHRTAVESIVSMHELPAAEADAVLGFDRTVFAPSLVESRGALGAVRYEPDERLSQAVASFPTKVDCRRASALGLTGDADAAAIIRQYAQDFPGAIHPSVRIVDEGMGAPIDDGAGESDAAVVLVTGGGSGIGRAVALRLAQGGWQRDGRRVALVLTGRRREVLEEVADEITEAARARGEAVSTLVHPADLTSASEVTDLFRAVRRTYGRVDVLFNNAGANVPPTRVDEMTYDAWRQVVGINFDAAFHVAREAFVLMKEQSPQGGRIINNGSVSAESPRPGSVAYTASKHGVTGLTKSLSLDGRAFGIACGQIDYGNVVSAISAGMAVGMPQADGSVRPEPRMSQNEAADAVHYMAALPLSANVLQMTVMATNMPLVGRG